MPTDPTEFARREESHRINSDPGSREALEAKYGKVWTTAEATADFTFNSFGAPYVSVIRKADGVAGTLTFQHSPRFYFDFQREDGVQEFPAVKEEAQECVVPPGMFEALNDALRKASIEALVEFKARDKSERVAFMRDHLNGLLVRACQLPDMFVDDPGLSSEWAATIISCGISTAMSVMIGSVKGTYGIEHSDDALNVILHKIIDVMSCEIAGPDNRAHKDVN